MILFEYKCVSRLERLNTEKEFIEGSFDKDLGQEAAVWTMGADRSKKPEKRKQNQRDGPKEPI